MKRYFIYGFVFLLNACLLFGDEPEESNNTTPNNGTTIGLNNGTTPETNNGTTPETNNGTTTNLNNGIPENCGNLVINEDEACDGELINDTCESEFGANFYGTVTCSDTCKLNFQCEFLGQVSAGLEHTCHLTPTGDIRCWGNDTDRQVTDTRG